MTISFVATAAGIDTTQGASVVLPAGILSGHRLLAVMASNAVTGYSHVAPAGWSLVTTSAGQAFGGDMFASVFTRVAGATDASDTVIFPVTPTGSKDALTVVAYAGTITPPEVVAAEITGVIPPTSVTTVPSPDITVDALPTLLVAAAAKKGGTTEIMFTLPAGFTQRGKGFATGGGAIAVDVADQAAAGTGATTVADWDTTTSAPHGVGALLGLAEGTPPPMAAPTFHRYTVSGWVPPLT